MPWRDDIRTDAVEYSDTPKDEGPAPEGEAIERGRVASLTATDGTREYDVELQFWRRLEATVEIESPTDSAAGFLAWRAADQSGRFGVLDGDAERVWFGADAFRHGGREYAFVDVGDGWRDELFWNDFFDRIYGGKLQYPAKQSGELRVVAAEPLVDCDGPTSEVYEVPTEDMGTEIVYRVQAWRPASSQAVYFAAHQCGDEAWRADRGVLDCGVPDVGVGGNLLSDVGAALSLDGETFRRLYRLAADLRDEDLVGLRVE